MCSKWKEEKNYHVSYTCFFSVSGAMLSRCHCAHMSRDTFLCAAHLFPGGDVCQCYYDNEHGHWDGNKTGCVECFYGWNMPDCKKCASSKRVPQSCCLNWHALG